MTKSLPVIAIGLDAAEPALVESWIEAGHLPNIASVRAKGGYARLQNEDYYRAETPWTTFLTGVRPQETGYWGPVKYRCPGYLVEDVKAYAFDDYKPFYSLDKERKVAVFDMPQTALAHELGGYQVIGWGAHSTQADSQSVPSTLLDELIEQHGEHPAFGKDIAKVYDFKDVTRLYEELRLGIERRAKICCDLLRREPLDLFLTIFGESHAAGHFFWHLDNEMHPMHEHYRKTGSNYLLECFKAMDAAIGEILEAAPPEAAVLIFSAHGMQSNNMDVPSTFFLPELLYRWTFPGEQAFSSTQRPPIHQGSNFINNEKWYKAIWTQYSSLSPLSKLWSELAPTPAQRGWALLLDKLGISDKETVVSPYQYKNEGGKFDWQPASWYAPSWPKMKAFALPSFSEGYIRINLEGRESAGIVSIDDYEKVCEEIESLLYELKNTRTGRTVVERVIRARERDTVDDPKLPDADLIVIWNNDAVTDSVASSQLGQIGPVQFQRSGSHTANGFVISNLKGLDASPSALPRHATDFAPTILSLMGVTVPQYMQGSNLFTESEALQEVSLA